MEFKNRTPFAAACFSALDLKGQEYHVVVMKSSFRLVPRSGNPGHFALEAMDDAPLPLCSADTYYGVPGYSSVLEESDYAPFKPKCDVLIHGHTWAPDGIPRRRWTPRILITAGRTPEEIPDPEPPQPLNQVMELTNDQLADWSRAKRKVQRQREIAALAAAERDVLLDKRLRVTGPRWFKRGLLRLWLRWRLTRPKKATQVPLRWERAFGGRSVLPNPKHQKNPKKPEYLVNSECYSNPIGCGWIDKRHFRTVRKARQKRPWKIPAPQFYYPFHPIRRLRRARFRRKALSAQKMAKIARRYPTPAGFGTVHRSWVPRLALAGTFDDQWAKAQAAAPALPPDFNARHYNCAPEDQQIDHLPADARIELWHLTDPAQTPSGYLRVELPAYRPFVLLCFEKQELRTLEMRTDSLRIDTDAMTLTLIHRARVPANLPVRWLQARFETDPDAPLVKLPPRDRAAEPPTARVKEA